ncbi:TonB-dependent receptor [Billgrantia pellis]|uniref:TonB-dependent receptor n=1 Tax=Billgrantia pellis TaxID=2606936 RepID=A0A7V7FYH3_9GAMM|nr:TonB-dependent receptor [Halomonas pellis]KAA0011443.1 TonB-dependent receptor [Halomonas pellis]
MTYPKKTRIVWLMPALLGSTLPGLVHAQSTTDETATDLSPLVVSATRNRSVAGKTPQKVTVITREQIEQQLAITSDRGQILGNLIPGYSPSRQKLSNTGETFRGRDALFLVDGVPQSNPMRDADRDSYTIDLDMVERIEVIHGASAEHGLGATGGIINFVTKRAEGGGVNHQVSSQLTFDDELDSEGFGHKLGYQLNAQQGNWDFFGGVTHQKRGIFRDGNGRNIGIDPIQGETQDSTSYDLFAKLGYWIDDNQNLVFSINRFELEGDNDYVRVSGDRAAGIPTSAERGTPNGEAPYNEAMTTQLAYHHADWFGNELDAKVYHQRFRAQFGPHPTAYPYQDEAGNTLYDQSRTRSDKLGAKFTLSRDGLFNDRLALATGVDLLQDETVQELTQTGRTYSPEATLNSAAAFLQGELRLADPLTLHAGVRQEWAELDVASYSTLDRDTSVENDLVAVGGGKPTFNETLFNIGLVYQATDWAQLFANYSQGFGMPDVGRVLRGVEDPGQDVDTLVDLSPIVTDNREVGARFDWGDYGLELSYFESDSDLGQRIEADDQGNYRVERERTEIRGVEISGDMRLNDTHDLQLSYAHTEGKSDTDGDDRVDTKLTGRNMAPDTLRLGWSAAWNDALSSHLQASHYFDRSYSANSDLEFDGYTLVDASLAYQLPVGRATFGIENLTDEQYITYYSQAGVVNDDLFFAGRGRTFTLGYQLDF